MTVLADILYEVERETARAVAKHGELPADLMRGLAILTGELGEAVASALDIERCDRVGNIGGATEANYNTCAELVQVAAVAVLLVQRLRSGTAS